MRGISLVVLWLSLLGLGVVWYFGQMTYRDKRAKSGEVVSLLRDSTDEEREEGYRKHNNDWLPEESFAFLNWRMLSMVLFGVVVCAAVWVSLIPTGPPASDHRTTRLAVQASMVGAGILGGGCAVLLFLLHRGAVMQPAYEWEWHQLSFLGFLGGAVVGALVGLLIARKGKGKVRPPG
jgi:MFS family permease